MGKKKKTRLSSIARGSCTAVFSAESGNAPEIPVRYRKGKLVFKGGETSFIGLTKFVRRGRSFLPLACTERWSSETVYDLAPLVSAGIAELVTISSVGPDSVARRYLDWLHNLSFCDTWYDAVKRSKALLEFDDRDDLMVLSAGLRSRLIDHNFPMIRQIYRTLMALRFYNPQSYCMAVFEGMRLSWPVAWMFMRWVKPFEFSFREDLDDGVIWYSNAVSRTLLKHGSVLYFKNGFHRISDGRGLSICLLCTFMARMYRSYGVLPESSSKMYIYSDDCLRYAENGLNRCIGDDAVGRFMNSGEFDVRVDQFQQKTFGDFGDSLALEGSYKSGGEGRELHEAEVLFRKATYPFASELHSGWLAVSDCYYGTIRSIVESCMGFACSERGVRLEETIKTANHEKLMAEFEKRHSPSEYRARAVKEAQTAAQVKVNALERQVAQLTQQLQLEKAKNEELNGFVDQKREIIAGMREELRTLNAQVQKMYELEDAVIVDNDGVSVEKMLDFVNQFRIVLVGDIDLLQQRMEEFGFTNFSVISSKHSVGMDASADFFCLCTKFLSHSLQCAVESRHPDELDHFFYFNSTNVEMLLRVCYKFISTWLEAVPDVDETDLS